MATGKPNLVALKMLVIGLGVAIMVVATVIVFELIRRAGQSDEPVEPAALPAVSAAPVLALDPERPVVARIALPDGAEVIDTYPMGGTLAIDLALPDGLRRILLIDPTTGQALGTFDLVPGE